MGEVFERGKEIEFLQHRFALKVLAKNSRTCKAALPQHMAVRLCLTENRVYLIRGCAADFSRRSLEKNLQSFRKGRAFPPCAAAKPLIDIHFEVTR